MSGTKRMRTLRADEISWEVAPLSTPHWLAMSDDDLLVAALAEAESYRLLAQQAIHTLHDRAVGIAGRDDTIERLRDELRRYTRTQIEAAP